MNGTKGLSLRIFYAFSSSTVSTYPKNGKCLKESYSASKRANFSWGEETKHLFGFSFFKKNFLIEDLIKISKKKKIHMIWEN